MIWHTPTKRCQREDAAEAESAGTTRLQGLLALCPFVENSLYSLLFAQSKLVVGGVAQRGVPLTSFVRVASDILRRCSVAHQLVTSDVTPDSGILDLISLDSVGQNPHE